MWHIIGLLLVLPLAADTTAHTLATHEAELSILANKVTSLDASIELLQGQMASLKQALHDAQRQSSTLGTALTTANDLITRQGQQITHLEAALRAMATTSSATYCVRSGDSLDKIAKAHATTIQALRALNNLQSDCIHPGQELRIPQ